MKYEMVVVATASVIVILVMMLQFFLWLRVNYEVKTSLVQWKGVIDVAQAESRLAIQKVDAQQAATTEADTALEKRLAEIIGALKAGELKQTALEESFAHFNAKTIAREREQIKAAKREGRAPAAEDDGEPLLAAIAEAERANAQARAPQNGGASNGGNGLRLRPKR